MDGLIILAVIVFAINMLSRSARKAQKQGRQQQPQTGRPRGVGRSMPNAPLDPASALEGNAPWGGFAKMLEKLELLGEEATPVPAPMPPVSYEGISMTDELGCVGGSMPHDAHQGEEFPGHQHRLIESAKVYKQTTEITEVQHASGKLNAGHMRNAVIMAEVLGRPVSMRRR